MKAMHIIAEAIDIHCSHKTPDISLNMSSLLFSIVFAENMYCSSCGVMLLGYGVTAFDCPNCGKTKIGRCQQCRNQSVRYTCSACGFSGP